MFDLLDDGSDSLNLALASDLTSAERAALEVHVCDSDGFGFSDTDERDLALHRSTWQWDGSDWSPPVMTRTLYLSLPANNAATGEPAISGTAQVGQDLTADASPIMDTDGLPSSFTYKWFRVDSDGTSNEAEISGETDATYTLTDDDEGKKIKVQVSFTDNLSGVEMRTSAAYPSSGTVTAASTTNTPPTAANKTVTTGEDRAYTFTADDFGFMDADTGDTLASVKIVTVPALGTLALDGTAVLADGVVTEAQIDGDMLTFTPARDAHGDSYTTFTFKVNDGTVDSASAYTMTIDVTDAPLPVCGVPSFGDRREIWSGTVTAEEFSFMGSVTGYGFQSSTGISSLLPSADFSIGSNNYAIAGLSVEKTGDLILNVATNTQLTATEKAALRLHVCDEDLDFSVAVSRMDDTRYGWTATLDWSHPVVTRTVYLSLPANHPATGVPAITGTAQAGQDLTADASPIMDADGLPSSFTYQWVRVDADGMSNPADITDATAATYTLTAADAGKKIKVKVSFTDQLSGEEERTSAAYPSSGTVIASANTTAPELTSVTVTSTPRKTTDTYGAREHIEFTMTFDAPVTVTGAPTFGFDLGGASTATWYAGSGTTTLRFSHAVSGGSSGDRDTNGISWAMNAIELNGGTIAGTDNAVTAILTHAAQSNLPGHKVDGRTTPVTPATVTDVVVTSTPTSLTDTYGFGETIVITVTVSEAVEVEGDPGFRFNIGNPGSTGNVVEATYDRTRSTATTMVFTYTVQAGDMDTNGFWIGPHSQTFLLDANDRIRTASQQIDIDRSHSAENTQSGHKVDGSLGAPTVPPDPTAPTLVSATATTLTIEWTHPGDGGSPLTRNFVHYRVEGTTDWTNWYAGETPVTRTVITNLEAETAYDVRVHSSNAIGNSQWAQSATAFSTLADDAGTNTAPTGANNTVTAVAGTAYAFEADDFGFADADTGDTLASVKIVTLPTPGTLALDGTAVLADADVTKAQIDGNMLTFTPVAGASSTTGYASFTFKVNDGTVDSASTYTMTIDVTTGSACAAPDFGTRRNIWTGEVTVAPRVIGGSVVGYGFLAGESVGSLDLREFSIGSNSYTVDAANVATFGQIAFSLTSNLTDTEVAALKLHVCDGGYDFADATTNEAASTYRWIEDIDWSMESTRTLHLSLPANNPATGTPTISGTAQVGQELTADASPIMDIDGLTGVDFTYQWLWVDSDGTSNEEDITGEIAATYTLTDDDVGKKVKVKVSFTDDLSGEEERTSAAYPPSGTVTVACPAPDFGTRRNIWTGEVTVAPRVIGGSVVGYGFLAGESVGSLDLREFSIGSNSYTVDAANVATFGQIAFSLTSNLTDTEVAALKLHVCDGGYDFADATTDEAASTYRWIEDIDWSMESTRTLHLSLPANNPATGTPTISGTAQVGQELTADASPIMDIDGLTGVDFTYQWLRVDSDGTSNEEDITGEIAATYTLTDDDVGKKVKVKVSFTDDLSGEEERTSAAYPPSGTVTVACPAPDFGTRRNIWTGEVTVAPRVIGGSVVGYGFLAGESVGSLDLREFSIGSNSYTVDAANVATFGQIAFSLTSNLTDTEVAALKLHVCDGGYDFADATTDEAASTYRWIEDIDWSMESTRTLHLSLPANNPATGTPTITGTAQVGEELTADASPIEDADGLTGVDFTYQWLRVDSDGTSNPVDITDANAATYTLTNDDLGKKVKVKVSFTDNLNGEETRTSDAYPSSATVTVAGGTNTPPTAANNTVTTGEDMPYTFMAGDFGFADTDTGATLASVKIVTTPALGTLALDGTAVLADDDVTKAQIDGDMLTFRPAQDAHGDAYTTFTFKVNDGTVDSASAYTMTIDVTDAPAPVCAAPSFGDRREIWTGTVTVEEFSFIGTVTGYGFQASTGISSLLPSAEFSIGSSDHTISAISVGVSGTLIVTVDANVLLTATEEAALRLHVCDENLDFSSASAVSAGYAWTGTRDWSDPVVTRTLYLSLPANNVATGEPAITGTAQVGQVLTADASPIVDDDGLTDVDFTYQWLRVDADGTSNEEDISGEIAATYTLTDDDEGKKIKVKVSFTDELSGEEERTSAAYPSSGTVTAAASTNNAPTSTEQLVDADEDTDYTFSADDFGFADTDAGDSLVSVKIVTLPASGTGTLTLSGTAIGSGDLPQTVLADDLDELKYSPPANLYGTDVASFTFKVNDGTVDSDNAYTMTIDVKGEDDSATGAPGITGTAQVGQTLTATVGTIADLDGLPDPFISHSLTTIQWIQVDGATEIDISGATNETYTLATADAGKKIKVKVSFEDEGGTAAGPLTSDAYPASGTVTAAGTNNAPVFSSSNVSRSIAENTAAGQNVGAAVTATDADAGDTLSYTLGGADVVSFDFVETTGQIRTKTNVSYDFEAKSSYTVTVTASDGTATADASVTIGITDVDEPPNAPATPTVSAVSGSTTRLSVSWAAPANAGKPAIASYDVQYRAGTSGAWTDGPQDVTGTTATVNQPRRGHRLSGAGSRHQRGRRLRMVQPARVRPDQRAEHIGARRAQRSWHRPGRRAGDAGLDGAGERRRGGHREVPLPGQRQRGLELGPGLDRRARRSGRGRQRGGRDDLHRVRSEQRHGVRLPAARREQRRRGPGGERRGHARARAAAPRVRFPGRQFRAARGPRRVDFRHAGYRGRVYHRRPRRRVAQHRISVLYKTAQHHRASDSLGHALPGERDGQPGDPGRTGGGAHRRAGDAAIDGHRADRRVRRAERHPP